jgi:hypothetical protein
MQVEDFEDDVYELIMEYITGDLAMEPLDNFMTRVGAFLKTYKEQRKVSKFCDDENWKCQVVEQESHFKTMLACMLCSRYSLRERKKTEKGGPILSKEENTMVLITEKELGVIIQESTELINRNPSAFAQQIADKVFSSM